MGLDTIFTNIFNYFSLDLFGSTVMFGLFLIVFLLILLFQMRASRFVVMAFVVPLMVILTLNSGWIEQTWIGYLAMIFGAIMLFVILRRIFTE